MYQKAGSIQTDQKFSESIKSESRLSKQPFESQKQPFEPRYESKYSLKKSGMQQEQPVKDKPMFKTVKDQSNKLICHLLEIQNYSPLNSSQQGRQSNKNRYEYNRNEEDDYRQNDQFNYLSQKNSV